MPGDVTAKPLRKSAFPESRACRSEVSTIVDLDSISFRYDACGSPVISGFSLRLPSSTSACIKGPSGSGKTTLLKLTAGILVPDSGEITVLGNRLSGLSESQRASFRLINIGYIFQEFNLIDYLTVRENVLFPHILANNPASTGMSATEANDRASQLLTRLEIGHKSHVFPDRLSRGEEQRVAIARALLLKPRLLLADEPTGNLDRERSALAADLLLSLKDKDASLIVASHSPMWRRRCDVVVDLEETL